jgi:hypothetical protein
MSSLKFNIQRRNGAYDIPLIKFSHRNTQINCLIDTGARVPVWCAGEEELKSLYPNCQRQDAVFLLSGFGNGSEIAEVYLIPDFALSDGKNTIHYKNLILAVIDKDFSFSLILSYNMFNKMNISIDTFISRNGTHSVTPNVKIATLKQEYYVGYRLKDISDYNKDNIIKRCKTENILDSIYIFIQD